MIVYEADSNGDSIYGKLETLVNYVKSGVPIRVGWVMEFNNPTTGKLIEIEHWTDSGFLTLIDGHVFAQINPIAQQSPRLTAPPQVRLINGEANGWVAIVGTNGVLEQRFKGGIASQIADSMKRAGATEEEIKGRLDGMNQMKVQTKWAINP